jgi:hypothetical protein
MSLILKIVVSSTQYKTLEKTQKKRASTQRHSNPSLIKWFRIFLTSGSCGLSLEVRYLDTL